VDDKFSCRLSVSTKFSSVLWDNTPLLVKFRLFLSSFDQLNKLPKIFYTFIVNFKETASSQATIDLPRQKVASKKKVVNWKCCRFDRNVPWNAVQYKKLVSGKVSFINTVINNNNVYF
jgi:hypothetical protein